MRYRLNLKLAYARHIDTHVGYNGQVSYNYVLYRGLRLVRRNYYRQWIYCRPTFVEGSIWFHMKGRLCYVTHRITEIFVHNLDNDWLLVIFANQVGMEECHNPSMSNRCHPRNMTQNCREYSVVVNVHYSHHCIY